MQSVFLESLNAMIIIFTILLLRPNPLKQFYPDLDDSDSADGSDLHTTVIRVDILPLSHGHTNYTHFHYHILLLSLFITILQNL